MIQRNTFRYALVALILAALACSSIPGLGGGADTEPTATPTATPELFGGRAQGEIGPGGEENEAPPGDGDLPDESGACSLLGTWEVDNASYLNFMKASAGDEMESVEGVMQITFEDDTMVSNVTDMNHTACGPDGCFTWNIEQVGMSEYTAENGILTVTGGGLVVATLPGGAQGEAATESGSAPYTCIGDELTIFYENSPPLLWNRVSGDS